MSSSVVDMSKSLDGYIADPDDFLGGEDGERLHDWFARGEESDRSSGPSRQFEEKWNSAGCPDVLEFGELRAAKNESQPLALRSSIGSSRCSSIHSNSVQSSPLS
jgi:hypothetical protein